ncbi:MAG: HNH endonuclease signature motif containing protein [Flavobacterium sp.]|uniref:HNH endonuclease n=1 Tax=Flavobacterium sp. TaxID=239 RepID=UPI0026315251|nr:HNH endonuclease signature motif containing protein [Flavobacterium sp.]MDD5151920.1 HNH endonuclease signature motif containing protein [Flavobacterium sp.]
MDYKRIYNEIIENRRLNDFEGYTENHHIIPKSVGGNDEKDNLVQLSAREHFICHYLLTKIYPYKSKEFYSMVKAFSMMGCSSKDHSNNRYINSRLYESNRKNMSEAMSKLQSGIKHSQYGTCWINNGIDNKKINKELMDGLKVE